MYCLKKKKEISERLRTHELFVVSLNFYFFHSLPFLSFFQSQIANALSLYRERNGGTEMGLTLLLAKKGLEKKEETKESKEVREPLQDEDFYIAVSGLKEIPEVVIVELRLAERANPHLKTTDWVKVFFPFCFCFFGFLYPFVFFSQKFFSQKYFCNIWFLTRI